MAIRRVSSAPPLYHAICVGWNARAGRDDPQGLWARLTAAGAVAGTGLAVISGAADWGTAHRLLAGLTLPPLAALVILAWVSARHLLLPALIALALFGAAAVMTGPTVHLALASAAFAATAVLAVQVIRSGTVALDANDLRDYVTLTKPRVMSLLLLTGGAGAFVGASGLPAASVFGATMIGLALACGGAAALNHYLDRDIDKLMGERTSTRPVAAGRILPGHALEFGIALSAASFVLLDSLVNLPTALLALGGNLFYVFVYTQWLKRSTSQNIVIGGAAGAVPPLVGAASATGHLGWAALAMFTIVFLWTPPHFWALALMIKEHYANARVPMLPVVRGDRETAKQIVFYSLALVAGTLVPVAFGVFGLVYGLAALVLGALMLWWAVALWRDTSRPKAVRLFHYSMLYLALLFVAMAVDVSV
jgi:protoheme IX farnesyltransferase